MLHPPLIAQPQPHIPDIAPAVSPFLVVDLRAHMDLHLQRGLEAVRVVVEGLALAAALPLLPRVAVRVRDFVVGHLLEGGLQGVPAGTGEGVFACFAGLAGLVCVWCSGGGGVQGVVTSSEALLFGTIQDLEVVERGGDIEYLARVRDHGVHACHADPRVHVAVGAVVRDHRVPAADLDKPRRIHRGEPIVGEELDRPRVVLVVRLLRFPHCFHRPHVKRLVGYDIFVRLYDDVHVAPEVKVQVVVDGLGEVEVLQLGEGLEGGHGDDVDTEDLRQSVVVHVERVLGCESAVLVRVKCACVFNHVDVFRWPACRDIAHHHLLQ